MLASIDLRSQHGRLVSARFNASVRKGVQGSCKRAASQAAGRAHRIVLQRSRPRRGGEKEGSKGLPGQNFSKCLLSLLPRHGVHRDRFICSLSLSGKEFSANGRWDRILHVHIFLLCFFDEQLGSVVGPVYLYGTYFYKLLTGAWWVVLVAPESDTGDWCGSCV